MKRRWRHIIKPCGFTDVVFNGKEYVCSKCGNRLGENFKLEVAQVLGLDAVKHLKPKEERP